MRRQRESIHIVLVLVLWPYNTSLYLYFPSWGDFFKVIFSHFVEIVDPSMNKGCIGCFNNCNLSVHSNTEVLVVCYLKMEWSILWRSLAISPCPLNFVTFIHTSLKLDLSLLLLWWGWNSCVKEYTPGFCSANVAALAIEYCVESFDESFFQWLLFWV